MNDSLTVASNLDVVFPCHGGAVPLTVAQIVAVGGGYAPKGDPDFIYYAVGYYQAAGGGGVTGFGGSAGAVGYLRKDGLSLEAFTVLAHDGLVYVPGRWANWDEPTVLQTVNMTILDPHALEVVGVAEDDRCGSAGSITFDEQGYGYVMGDGRKLYILIANDGSTIAYLDVPPGLDIDRLLANRVGVRGTPHFNEDLGARLITVRDIDKLGPRR